MSLTGEMVVTLRATKPLTKIGLWPFSTMSFNFWIFLEKKGWEISQKNRNPDPLLIKAVSGRSSRRMSVFEPIIRGLKCDIFY